MGIDLKDYEKTSIEFVLSQESFDRELDSGFSSAVASMAKLDPDLMFMHFLLCHEGANVNWDWFKKDVLERAVNTCVNKPINIEHEQPVIGVMTDAVYRSPENKPAYIECLGVIWKFVYPEIAEEIKNKGKIGELKVSMECYFKEPDYMVNGVVYNYEAAVSIGLHEYHARRQLYLGYPVYRVFREVIFGGVGVVENPADKGAHILAVAKSNDNTGQPISVLDEIANLLESLDDQEKIEKLNLFKEIALNKGELEVSVQVGGDSTECSAEILDNSLGSEVKDNMDIKELLEKMQEIKAGMKEEDDMFGALASAIDVLSGKDITKEVEVEVPVDNPELVAKANELEKKLEELKEEYASYKEEVEREKAEAKAVELANKRMEELNSLGITFSEARTSKVFEKVKSMSDEDYAEYKEELIEAMASAKKKACSEEEEKVDESLATEEPVEEGVAKAHAINIEIPENVDPYSLIWKN